MQNEPIDFATPRKPTLRFMLSHPVHILSMGFGSGLAPFMPGTFGTLFGWGVFALLAPYLSTTAWLIVVVLGFIVGVYATGFTARRLGVADPGSAVWDEVVAIWLVLALVAPQDWRGQLGSFLAFRFFDMVKPPPVRYFDRHVKGGFGIMIDDIVAALMSLLLIALWRTILG
ncbi:phosphatidylglycerophosphatase A family protein [Chitinasiproducens palmae]|uniref:Phosphatidylglycerophosphatase A n=1 Tax=Chitinasiproducens palmae TaxID=1770053 RepID=A0A1H2PRK5_9BURK|nr:phosphatidylglycerophosphatase A [Chitinasiproducens palmae]SDV49532.1 phosphatidylglycerophosphatase [Chitinasiproducens palmae]